MAQRKTLFGVLLFHSVLDAYWETNYDLILVLKIAYHNHGMNTIMYRRIKYRKQTTKPARTKPEQTEPEWIESEPNENKQRDRSLIYNNIDVKNQITAAIKEVIESAHIIICTVNDKSLEIGLRKIISDTFRETEIIVAKHCDLSSANSRQICDVEKHSAISFMNVNHDKKTYDLVKEILNQITEKELIVAEFYDVFGFYPLFVAITLGLVNNGPFGKFLLRGLYDPRIFLFIASMLGHDEEDS